MVYFELSRIGFNCGLDKQNCKLYPQNCIQCIKEKLNSLGLEVQSNFKISEIDSEEKRLQMYREIIWQKFWDVLNIKHIIIMSKNSGLSIIDYPITGSGIDISLLTGFIQANMTFSESGNSKPVLKNTKRYFYEFDYKDFTILLKNSRYTRACLVLEKKASESLKTTVNEFLRGFDSRYQEKIIKYERTGLFNFNGSIDFIIESFEVKLMFPMVLSHTVPPGITEKINENYIKKAIMNIANEILINKPFFFVNKVLNSVIEIVDIEPAAVLYEIYQLLEMEVIIPTKLEVAESKAKSFNENRAMNLEKNESLSSLLTNESDFQVLKQELEHLNEEEASNLMEKYVRKGKNAEDALIYQAALKEYEKALYLASGFNFEKDIGRISFLILELEKKINDMELDYAENAAEKAEKRKDYIDSIRFYKKAIKLLERGLDTVKVDPANTETKIRKLKKKISKLEARI
ncbi:MAG: hypothetical protein EU548_08815 [Promethearchaeota archaeon]|nr:MAG: hypothetical protein EU548_08815 [Candidatus Lokiarchaeota archaeon]